VADTVTLDSRSFLLSGLKGGPLLVPAALGMQTCVRSTACYRGYVAHYTCAGGELYLDSLLVRTADGRYPLVGGRGASPMPGGDDRCYEGLRLPCRMTGGLVVVDEPLAGSVMSVVPTPPGYGMVLELLFEEGRLTSVVDHSSAMDAIRSRARAWMDAHTHDEWSREEYHELRSILWSFAPGYEDQPPVFVR
jgi:hypothetical protein